MGFTLGCLWSILRVTDPRGQVVDRRQIWMSASNQQLEWPTPNVSPEHLAPNFTKKTNGFNFVIYTWDDCVFASHLACQWDGVYGGEKDNQCKIANEPNPSGFGYMLIMQFVVLLFLTSPKPLDISQPLGAGWGGWHLASDSLSNVIAFLCVSRIFFFRVTVYNPDG